MRNTLLCAVFLLLAACNLTQPSESSLSVTPAPVAVIAEGDNTPTPLYLFPEPVAQHIKAVYIYGQALGNRPDVFSKVGDSITVNTNFLHPIGEGVYNLAAYSQLQSVVDTFSVTQARTANSFGNKSLAATVGWSAFAALTPSNANFSVCARGETPLACEYRLSRPSFALIFFGTNDVGFRSREAFRADMRQIIEITEGAGVIPIISTIPKRPGYETTVTEFNQIIFDLTTEYKLPVWEYSAVMETLPNYGLTYDNVHPSSPPGSYDNAANFSPEYLRYGYVVRNLTALQILDRVWRQVTAP
jgi:hypothetical protein